MASTFIRLPVLSSSGSSGDVTGPSSSTNNAIAKFNGTSGKTIQNSGVIVDASDNITGINNLTLGGNLTVNGTTTTVNSTTLDVADANITVNNGGTQASANSGNAGLRVTMSDATDVQIGYDSTLASKFKIGEAGSEIEIANVSSTQTFSNKTLDNSNAITVQDSNFAVQNNSDNTKQINFNLSNISTSTTRTLTVPDASDEIVLRAAAQTIANKVFGVNNTFNFNDNTTDFRDNGDLSKRMEFQLSNLPTSTTVRISPAVVDGTMLVENAPINYGGDSELTISSGSVAATKSYHTIDTESDAATDNLDTISGGSTGDVLIIRPENDARTVVAKNGTGNLLLMGDFEMDSQYDMLQLSFVGSNWVETSRSKYNKKDIILRARFTSGTQSIPDNVNTKVTSWNNITEDSASGWDATNNEYIVQQSGVYIASALLRFSADPQNDYTITNIILYVNGSAVFGGQDGFNTSIVTSAPSLLGSLSLEKGDTVSIYVNQRNDNANSNDIVGSGVYSYFSLAKTSAN